MIAGLAKRVKLRSMQDMRRVVGVNIIVSGITRPMSLMAIHRMLD
jgi:hypothetical protein